MSPHFSVFVDRWFTTGVSCDHRHVTQTGELRMEILVLSESSFVLFSRCRLGSTFVVPTLENIYENV